MADLNCNYHLLEAESVAAGLKLCRSSEINAILLDGHDITDLKQIQMTLEQRNQHLDSFVHIVSHDLKAPLRAVANLA